MPEVELKDKFLCEGIHEDELKLILSQGDATSDGEKFLYFGDQVEVTYSNSGKILSIRGDPKSGLVLTALKNIREAILTDHGSRIGRAVIFSTLPITGSFRFENEFQLLPLVPQSNYGPTTGRGDYPAVLEVRYPVSSNDLLDSQRRWSKLKKITRFINLVSRWGVSYPLNYSTWARVPRSWEQPSSEEIEAGETKLQPSIHVDAMHINTGFAVNEDFLVYSDEFCDETIQQAQFVDTAEYYGSFGIGLDEEFRLPTSINDFCKSYFNLSDNLDQFDRALYWYATSSQVNIVSASLSFVALIQSIETMCDSEPETFQCDRCGDQVLIQTPCDTCGRVKKDRGPTRLFREFVETYAPNLPARVRGNMYSLRSSISHGAALMVTDEDLSGFTFDRKSHDHRSLSRVAQSVAQASLLNWLVR